MSFTTRCTRSSEHESLIGVPGSAGAATTGYVDRGGGIVKFSRRFESMGGVMVWNALHLREDKKGLLGQV